MPDAANLSTKAKLYVPSVAFVEVLLYSQVDICRQEVFC